eukprot:scaffold431_cov334-Pavlova_lutheri.AAC.44
MGTGQRRGRPRAEKLQQAFLFGREHHGFRCGGAVVTVASTVPSPHLPACRRTSRRTTDGSSRRGPTRLTGGGIAPASARPRAPQRSDGVGVGSSFFPPFDRYLPFELSMVARPRYRWIPPGISMGQADVPVPLSPVDPVRPGPPQGSFFSADRAPPPSSSQRLTSM